MWEGLQFQLGRYGAKLMLFVGIVIVLVIMFIIAAIWDALDARKRRKKANAMIQDKKRRK